MRKKRTWQGAVLVQGQARASRYMYLTLAVFKKNFASEYLDTVKQWGISLTNGQIALTYSCNT